MKKKASDKHFIKKPTYIGGLKAMREFISKEMRYPESALKNKIEGTVYLKYEVDYKGSVVSTKVLSHLSHDCDMEAQRLVSKLKFYVGKNPRNMKITFNKSIKIHFRLPKNKELETPVKPKISIQKSLQKVENIVYTITSTPKKNDNKSNTEGYSYTIKY